MAKYLVLLLLVWFIATIFVPKETAPFFKSRPRLKAFFIFIFASIAIVTLFPDKNVPKEVPSPTPISTEKKQSQETITQSHDVTTEKAELQKIVKESPNTTTIDVMEMRDGIYSILFNIDVDTTDETAIRSNIVSIMHQIMNSTKGKNYKVESIHIIALYKKSPLGMYNFISSEFSISGTDEYSITQNGNSEKFIP